VPHTASAPPAENGPAPGRPARHNYTPEFLEYARTRDPKLRNLLVSGHMGLANQLARRYTNRGEPFDDLLQVASVGLIFSVERFDPECGAAFSTFATRTVLGELKRHFRDKGWLVRPPRRIQELALELREAIQLRTHELRRPPTIAELVSAIGSTEEAVLEAIEADSGYSAQSIDAPGEHDRSLADRLGADENAYGMVDDLSVLEPALARLSPRDQTIMRLRFVSGLTQSQIAMRVGLSQMQISRVLASSLKRLEKEFAEFGVTSSMFEGGAS
jgi:RNA polymerase sigma-B factor